jgi:hypothetical protein
MCAESANHIELMDAAYGYIGLVKQSTFVLADSLLALASVSVGHIRTVIFSFPRCLITPNVPSNRSVIISFPQITANVPPMVAFSQ